VSIAWKSPALSAWQEETTSGCKTRGHRGASRPHCRLLLMRVSFSPDPALRKVRSFHLQMQSVHTHCRLVQLNHRLLLCSFCFSTGLDARGPGGELSLTNTSCRTASRKSAVRQWNCSFREKEHLLFNDKTPFRTASTYPAIASRFNTRSLPMPTCSRQLSPRAAANAVRTHQTSERHCLVQHSRFELHSAC
jgi:hypothetical protein